MKIKLIYFSLLFFNYSYATENIDTPIFKVTKGNISKQIIASGQIFSPNSSAIRIARYGDSWETKISWIAPEGSFVKKGDDVLKLDTSNLEKSLDQAEDQLLNAELNLKTAEIKLQIDISTGEADIKTKQYNLEKAKLSVQTGDYVPLNDQKKAMIDLNSAIADYAQSKKNLVQNKLSDNFQIKALQAPVKQYQTNVSKYHDDIKKMTLIAESSGYIIYNYIQSMTGLVRPGAGVSPYPFSKIAEISNTSNLQAKLFIPEIDTVSVQIGTPVTLYLLSNPDEKVTGKVTNINKISSTSAEQRGGSATSPSDLLPQNTMIITLDKTPTDALPGMTVKAILSPPEKKGVLKIPLFVLANEPKNSLTASVKAALNINEAYVFTHKKSEKKWGWQKVTIGETSYGFAEITSGLAEGDEVRPQ